MTTPATVRSVYVHVPFCHTICGYCDFYSQVLDKAAAPSLVDSLLAELRGWREQVDLRAETIFVGGGTPTTLPPGELARLLAALHELAPDAKRLEFTVEANPATVAPDIAGVLAASGVNRVSIGAQSFDAGELRVLERIHRPSQVAETVAECRRRGIEQINLDLIFAVPGQTLASWLRNLDAALALATPHLSCYGLTYERGTPLFEQLAAGQVQRVETELEAAMYEATIDAIAAAGLLQYEISNYARPGCECRHNLTYWHNEPSLGIGPSAAGLVGGLRYRNVPDTAEYVRALREGRSACIEQERLTPDRRARETAMLELRLNAGILVGRFAERFGHDPREFFAEPIARHTELGLLEADERGVRLTRRGRLVADTVIADFL